MTVLGALHDALGNAEALIRLLNGERWPSPSGPSEESSACKEFVEVIDIRELRKDPSAYLSKLSRKGAEGLVQELLEVDGAWRAAKAVSEELRARLKSSGKPTPGQLQELQRAKEEFQETESRLAELERRRKQLLDRVPNPPADDVPSGGEEDFEVLREVGQKPSFDFAARDHLDLAQAHGWIDAARGTKVSGSAVVACDALLNVTLVPQRYLRNDGDAVYYAALRVRNHSMNCFQGGEL